MKSITIDYTAIRSYIVYFSARLGKIENSAAVISVVQDVTVYNNLKKRINPELE